jgi:hypothetical protein|tara:strand:+ start:40 stop:189 length:150 start_codon:yes stop_codon:yes gene_type:complete
MLQGTFFPMAATLFLTALALDSIAIPSTVVGSSPPTPSPLLDFCASFSA